MKDLPEEMTEADLALALVDGWGIEAGALQYAPVGGGSYHWIVGDGDESRYFVTVDDLDDKGWLGRTRPAVFAGLRAAMDAAATLRTEAALEFVVAPLPAQDGATVRPLGARHAVAAFPFLRGSAGRWGEPLPAPERDELVTMLAALHGASPAAVRLAPAATALSWRDDLEAALREVGQPWTAGPFAESARALVAAAGGPVRRGLACWDRWADAVTSAGLVITHGEPHPGNVMRTTARTGDRERTELRLIDWDTVGLAPPARDLWLVATEGGEELRRYAELTGRAVDPAALAAYRLRWSLDDICSFVRQLRAPHRPTLDAQHALRALQSSLSQLPP